MAHHKVLTTPVKGRDYPNKKGGGDLVVWTFELEGLGPVELHKKEGNDPPPNGDVLNVEDSWDGEFNDQPFKRIKLAYEAGGNSTGGAESKNFDRRPEHPQNEARMKHTSALSAAPAYYELMRTEGVLPKAESKQAMLETLRGIIKWIEGGYPNAPQPLPAPPSDVPADMDGLEQKPLDPDSQIPF